MLTDVRLAKDFVERGHAVISLMIVGGALFSLFTTPGPAGGASSPLAALTWPFVFFPGMLFALRSPKRMLSLLWLGEPFLLGIVALAFASTLWSLLPAYTLSKAARLLTFVLYACYLASRYGVDELLSIARWSVRLGLILSILTAVLDPKIGIHHDFIQGAWRGLYAHKNTLGRSGSLIICLAVASRLDKLPNSRKFLMLDLALGGVVLFFAESRTALLLTLVMMFWSGLYQIWLISNRSLRRTLTGFALMGTFAALPLVYMLLEFLGKARIDHLLTGRVSLWRTVLYFISKRPLTGYGYQAFFHELTYGKVIELWEGWEIPHAHNALLDLWITLGVGAIALYLFSILLMLWRSGKASGSCGHTAFMILGFNLIMGLTETACYPRPELTTLLFVFISLHLSMQGKRQSPLQNSRPSSPKSTDSPTPGSLP